jgi:hypothetical protein
MRLYRSKKFIVTLIHILLLAAISIIPYIGCSSKPNGQKPSTTTKDKTISDKKGDWTDTILGSWYLRLHGPGPAGQHPVWEGPVEIGDKPNIFFCKINLELIDSMWVGPQNNILVFEGYSGSKTYNYVVKADSCIFLTKLMPVMANEKP